MPILTICLCYSTCKYIQDNSNNIDYHDNNDDGNDNDIDDNDNKSEINVRSLMSQRERERERESERIIKVTVRRERGEERRTY